jgi:hypothetical protein
MGESESTQMINYEISSGCKHGGVAEEKTEQLTCQPHALHGCMSVINRVEMILFVFLMTGEIT